MFVILLNVYAYVVLFIFEKVYYRTSWYRDNVVEFYSGLTDSEFGWVVTYPQVFLSPLGTVAIVPSLGRIHCLSCACGVYLH